MTLAAGTVETYLAQLASKAPTPGGGAAVGLTGAQAAALIAMALEVSGGSDAELTVIREKLLALADEDARVFAAVMAAYKLPKTDEARAAKIEAALKDATRVPLEAMRALASLYPKAEAMLPQIKKSVVSDVGVGIELAHAALKSSLYTVRINLAAIKDQAFVAATKAETERLLAVPGGSAVLKKIDEVLG